MVPPSTDVRDHGDRLHEGRHPDAPVEEWVFAAWTPDAQLGVISGHRLVGRTSWSWAALAREGRPLLHIADFEVPVRSDPFIVKGEALWAEHHCDADMEQWSIGNETYASSIEHAQDALGLAYGDPTPIAFDLEWYATAAATSLGAPGDSVDGYEQAGVVHGAIDVLGEPRLELAEIPAHRWHRWAGTDHLAPLALPSVTAHTGVRSPFAFPDGSVSDLVLTAQGWALRTRVAQTSGLSGVPSRPEVRSPRVSDS
jgi:hypothetical protein